MTKRTFATLDGMRGVAAICIVVLHAHRFYLDPLPAAQMAVDLFFVLSGFVLAHSYGHRFRQGMTPLTFMALRFARLYPLYLLGILLGVIEGVLATRYHLSGTGWTPHVLLTALPFNLLMLPNPLSGASGVLFPFNGIMWSIFLELLVNAVWAIAWRALESTRILVGTIVAAAGAFTAIALWTDTTALGLTWGTFPGGLARVLFSFLAGVLIHRFHDRVHIVGLPPLILIAVLPVLAAFPLGTSAQLLCALVVFPALVLLGSRTEPVGRRRAFCLALGVASYGVYTVHKRLYDLSCGFLLYGLGINAMDHVSLVGVTFLLVLIAGSIAFATKVESPARRALTRLLVRRTQPKPA
jgi:peptidoglycan/LPS O-acetylase OafA/YrhL